MTMLRAGRIAGRVADADGTPIEGEVSVRRDGEYLGAVQIDSDGDYSVVGVPPGDFDLCVRPYGTTTDLAPAGFLVRCSDPGADGIATPVHVDEGRKAVVDVSPSVAAGVSGVVTTTDGRPLRAAYATVIANGVDLGGDQTDASGRFEVDRVPAGSYQVCISAPYASADGAPAGSVWAGHCLGAAPGAGPGSTVDLSTGTVRDTGTTTLPYGAVVSGQVRQGNRSVPYNLVTARGSGATFTSYSDSNGRYRLVVPAGIYTFCARKAGVAAACYDRTTPDAATRVRIVEHGDRDDLDIRFAPR